VSQKELAKRHSEGIGKLYNLVDFINHLNNTDLYNSPLNIQNSYYRAIESNNGHFDITSVHRDDLLHLGFDTSEVDDDTMLNLAAKLADDYCEQLFWGSLETIASILGIPKTSE
jgi:hypothetical protein